MNLRAGNCETIAFTLVELMVVILIIGILTGVMIAEMGGTYEDSLLRANARKIADLCDTASNRAIAVHEAQMLRIDTRSGKFSVQAKAPEAESADTVTTEGELDNRVNLVVREPAREAESDETEPTEDVNAITFYPDGSADAREFLFRDRAGVEIVLRINPATSRVRIIEMAAQ